MAIKHSRKPLETCRMKDLWEHIYICQICHKSFGSDFKKRTPCHECSMKLQGKKARGTK